MRRVTMVLLVSALAASTTPLGAANREHEQLMADIRN